MKLLSFIIILIGGLTIHEGAFAFKARNTFLSPTGRDIHMKHNKRAAPLQSLQRSLALRGGAGDGPMLGLDVSDPSQLFTAAYLVQGAIFTLAPEQQAKFYNWWSPDSAGEINFLTENLGMVVFAKGVASYCATVKGKDPLTCLGYCAMACVPFAVRAYLTGSYLEAGMSNIKFTPLHVANLFYGFTAFTNPTWATTVLRSLMAFYTVMALQGILVPQSFLAGWTSDILPKWKTLFLVKGYSFFLLGLEIHNWLLLSGVDPDKAMAYSSIPCLFHFLYSLFLSKEALRAGRPIGYIFWAVLFSYCIIASILMQ